MATACDETNLQEEKYNIDFVVPLIVYLLTTSITSIILNLLVLLTIWKTPSLQTPSKFLLCSLALTDLLTGVAVEPAYIASCLLALERRCSDFDAVYHFASRLGYSLGAISMVTLTAISADRYLAIKTKHNYKSVVTRKRSIIFLGFVWTVPGTAVFLIRYLKSDNKNDTKYVVMVIAPLLLAITIFYSMSFYFLKKFSPRIVNPVNQFSAHRSEANFNIWKYKRSLITMVMILGIILVSYLPVVVLLSTRTLSELLYDPGLLHLCESFVLLNSTLNPVLYLWRMKDLRQSLKNLLGL